MKRKLTAALLAIVVAFAFMPAAAFASSKAKMTVCTDAVKCGNTVYCATAGFGICKVTVKNGKVKSKKWLDKSDWCYGPFSYISDMKKKGNYLYYIQGSEGTVSYLYRMNVKTGKKKQLCKNVEKDAIKGKKIYAKVWKENNYGDMTYFKRSMKLNGASKKKTSVKAVMRIVVSNAKGYSVVYKEKNGYVKSYLKTPKGKFYLGKSEDPVASYD